MENEMKYNTGLPNKPCKTKPTSFFDELIFKSVKRQENPVYLDFSKALIGY